jgi:hypothetical protein
MCDCGMTWMVYSVSAGRLAGGVAGAAPSPRTAATPQVNNDAHARNHRRKEQVTARLLCKRSFRAGIIERQKLRNRKRRMISAVCGCLQSSRMTTPPLLIW